MGLEAGHVEAAHRPDGSESLRQLLDLAAGAAGVRRRIGLPQLLSQRRQVPGGGLVAVGSGSGDVEILDYDSLEAVGTLVGNRSNSGPSFWSEDGRRLLTGGYDFTLRVWDTDTMTQIGRVLPASNNYSAMSSDGELVVLATDEGLQLWDFNVDHWFEHACELAGRNLTEAEWDEFGPRTVERRATCPQYPI